MWQVLSITMTVLTVIQASTVLQWLVDSLLACAGGVTSVQGVPNHQCRMFLNQVSEWLVTKKIGVFVCVCGYVCVCFEYSEVIQVYDSDEKFWYVCVCVCLCVCVCVCVSVSLCVYSRVHAYIHAYIHSYACVKHFLSGLSIKNNQLKHSIL